MGTGASTCLTGSWLIGASLALFYAAQSALVASQGRSAGVLVMPAGGVSVAVPAALWLARSMQIAGILLLALTNAPLVYLAVIDRGLSFRHEAIETSSRVQTP